MAAEKKRSLVEAIKECQQFLDEKWPRKRFDAISASNEDNERIWTITFQDLIDDEFVFEYHKCTGKFGLIYYTTEGQWGPHVYTNPLNPVPRNE